jgi:hypothetical protein
VKGSSAPLTGRSPLARGARQQAGAAQFAGQILGAQATEHHIGRPRQPSGPRDRGAKRLDHLIIRNLVARLWEQAALGHGENV